MMSNIRWVKAMSARSNTEWYLQLIFHYMHCEDAIPSNYLENVENSSMPT